MTTPTPSPPFGGFASHPAAKPADLAAAVEAGRRNDTSSEARQLVRAACANDLLFVAMIVCGFSRLDPERHRPIADFGLRIMRTPDGCGLAEDPRGVGKTTLLVIAGSIQPIIAPPEPGTPFAGADTTFVIASRKKERAAERVSLIMQHWEHNLLLRWLMPDVRPDYAKRWSTEAASITRPTASVDVTYQTVGVDTGQAGPHGHIWLADDFIDESNWFSPTEIRRACDFIRSSKGVVQPHNGSRLIIENQWTLYDVNHWLKHPEEYTPEERFDARVEIFSRGLTSCAGCVGGRARRPDGRLELHVHSAPVFPTLRWHPGDKRTPPKRLTLDDLEELRRQWGPRMYSAQGENDPLDPEMLKLREDWLRSCELIKNPREGLCVRFRLPEAENATQVPVSALYRVLTFDTGHQPQAQGASRSAIQVVGFHEPSGAFLHLEEWAAKVEPLDAIKQALDMWVRWVPQRSGIDRVGYQRIIGPLMTRIGREEYGIGERRDLPAITSGNEGDTMANVWLLGMSGDKDARLLGALEPLARTNRLYVSPQAVLTRDEWRRFPMSGLKDLLECLAMVPRLLAGQHRITVEQREKIAHLRRVRRARSWLRRDPLSDF